MGLTIGKKNRNKRKVIMEDMPMEEILDQPPQQQYQQPPQQQYQQPTQQVHPEDDHEYLSELILKKTRTIEKEKAEITKLRERMENDVREIEALQYIMTGDPTISIADLLEIIHDYKETDGDKSATELLDDIERSLLKSTIDGM